MHQVAIKMLDNADREAVHALLRGHGLPLDGLNDEHVIGLVAKLDGRVVGSVAVEVYGRYGLLRSLAVADEYRGHSLGSRLTREAMVLAEKRGLLALYLLTETAAGFFPKLGFKPVSRADMPAAVKTSVEFTTACPASAAAFVARLQRDKHSP